MADLSVEFAGVKFKNPILLSSAEPTFNFEAMKKGIDKGIGGVVTKSYTSDESLRAMAKRPEASLLDDDGKLVMGTIPALYTLISRTCFAKEDMEDWLRILERTVLYAREQDAVVIGSVAETTVESWVDTAKRMEETGVGMLELNFGCPHYGPGGHGGPVSQDDELAIEVVRAVNHSVSIPIIVKETPRLSNIVASVRKVHEAGADAVTLTNRFNGLLLDIDTAKPYIHGVGGCGGPWVKPFTLHSIHQVATAMEIPISGSNGAINWKDTIEFMMVGATTVQFCTAVMVHGYRVLAEILQGISDFLDEKGYSSIHDIIGAANQHVLPYSEAVRLPKVRYEVDEDKCIKCGACVEACFFGAIVNEGDQLRITEDCNGCSFCQSICPESAIMQSKNTE